MSLEGFIDMDQYPYIASCYIISYNVVEHVISFKIKLLNDTYFYNSLRIIPSFAASTKRSVLNIYPICV